MHLVGIDSELVEIQSSFGETQRHVFGVVIALEGLTGVWCPEARKERFRAVKLPACSRVSVLPVIYTKGPGMQGLQVSLVLAMIAIVGEGNKGQVDWVEQSAEHQS